MAKVVWTNRAIEDLRGIIEHLSAQDPQAGSDYSDRFMSRVEQLVKFPASGSLIKKTTSRTYRILVVAPYVIWYYAKGDGCYIAKIVHGRRQQG